MCTVDGDVTRRLDSSVVHMTSCCEYSWLPHHVMCDGLDCSHAAIMRQEHMLLLQLHSYHNLEMFVPAWSCCAAQGGGSRMSRKGSRCRWHVTCRSHPSSRTPSIML